MKELIPSSALPLADYLVAYAAFSAALLVLAVDPDLNILSAGALGIMIGLDRSRRCSLGVAACRDVRACAYCGGRLGDHAARPEHGHRGRQTRSLSEPFVRSIFLCWAIATLVPTPSVLVARTGCVYDDSRRASYRPAKPPMPPRTSGPWVFATQPFMRATARSPASVSTPADA